MEREQLEMAYLDLQEKCRPFQVCVKILSHIVHRVVSIHKNYYYSILHACDVHVMCMYVHVMYTGPTGGTD